jgi:hypothetical protein
MVVMPARSAYSNVTFSTAHNRCLNMLLEGFFLRRSG